MTLRESRQQTPTFGGETELAGVGGEAAASSLGHTPQEHRLYELMFEETSGADPRVACFTIRYLMDAVGGNGYTAVRMARAGLIKKLSIEFLGGDSRGRSEALYRVYTPEEILARRSAAGLRPCGEGVAAAAAAASGPRRGAEWLREELNLSRRESQVAAFCAEGLTNAGIGERLRISEETVKFHLRHVFLKLGVSRRAELARYILSRQ